MKQKFKSVFRFALLKELCHFLLLIRCHIVAIRTEDKEKV
jgi:hypothetical protein